MNVPVIIAGPCSAESRVQTIETYKALAAIGIDCFRAGVWKPRTRPCQWEGAGEEAFEWLVQGRQETGIPFGVEVGSPQHVETALKYGADMVWLGARTVSNPFSVQAIADALSGVNVAVWIKNPLVADVELWSGAVERVLTAGIKRVGTIHRGFSCGQGNEYRNPPLWHIAIEMRRRFADIFMLCDPSHIAGERQKVADIAHKAADMYYDGLFVESHISPETALSDAAQQLTPAELTTLLNTLSWRTESSENPDFNMQLEKLRSEIDSLDAELLSALMRRMEVSGRIGEIKRVNGVAIVQPSRWNSLLTSLTERGEQLGLTADFVRSLFALIHEESVRRQ